MRIALWITTGLTGLLLFSTLACGLWIRSRGDAAAQSDINFHMGIALLTIAVTVVTLVMYVLRAAQLTAA